MAKEQKDEEEKLARVEEAGVLLAAVSKEKADDSARAAAKAKADAEAAERAALTPEQRLGADWPEKHKVLAPFITELGKVRGGLNLPDQAKAKEFLKSYGIRA